MKSLRFRIFQVLIRLAMRALPACEYKSHLSASHWVLELRMQARLAALTAARVGSTEAAAGDLGGGGSD